MSFTAAQSKAISARGNVLLIAGAGTGKTRTLVERCIDCLLHETPRVSLDQILMVTFTEAAAAEMRQRIRHRLEQESAKDPGSSWWQEQIALFDTAHIGTLHSFCLRLIREHFYQLELDPQLTILAEEEARLLANDTLEALMQEFYAGKESLAEAVRNLIQDQGRGSDKSIRGLVLKVHRYTQTLPGAAQWLENQKKLFAEPSPVLWTEWLQTTLADWKQRWSPFLVDEAPHNHLAGQCLATLRNLAVPVDPQLAFAALEAICRCIAECPRGHKTLWANPLKEFQAEAQFLGSLARPESGLDPLAQDWLWVRGHMGTLVELAARFSHNFTETKRELGVLDFQDLEQYALRLLWDPQVQKPTDIARLWRDKLRFVFVDEYQDINAAQDKIIECLSREGAHANRFLVGDVKQSIYRFRLADPAIFQGYAAAWRAGIGGCTIPLQDNFRSRAAILTFVNSLFSQVMHAEIGGVVYDDAAHLRCGQRENAPTPPPQTTHAVELHLRLKALDAEPNGDEALDPLKDLAEADKEARLVALRLQELKRSGSLICDDAEGRFRPVDWKDMAVLLRSPSGKAESYAKEFSSLGLPLIVERGGFYTSIEVSDLISLLQLLDNPLQDIPALAVLRSPMVGLGVNELALIRLASQGRFWTALVRWHQAQLTRKPKPRSRASEQPQLPGMDGNGEGEEHLISAAAFKKVDAFLQRFSRWRDLVRHASLCRCLEAVLGETHYHSWLLTQPRGEQRHANVSRLLGLAQQFDRFQRQGLFRFLRFLEAQQEADAEPSVAATSAENAVRLMSIHQSKGLEFPVVVLADLGKTFNYSDLKAEIILDPKFGLCPQVKPLHTGKTYPSLAYWLARQRQTRELLGEELRLLYVAATRARDKLLLVGSVGRRRFDDLWRSSGDLNLMTLLRARSYSDWLGRWFARNTPTFEDTAVSGKTAHLHWMLHDESALADAPGPLLTGADTQASEPFDEAAWRAVQTKLAPPYSYLAATAQPAKTSVTLLRLRAALAEDDETSSPLPFASETVQYRGSKSEPAKAGAGVAGISSMAVGSAYHLFMQLVPLEQTGSLAALKAEAARLLNSGALTPAQAAALDLQAIAVFWNGALGREIRAHAQSVWRELPFTFRAVVNELGAHIGITPSSPELEQEFVVVQGVADLAVILSHEIWLVDFKTDSVGKQDLPEKVALYAPQLRIYAWALGRIYARPVTRCALYFFALGQEVPVTLAQELTLA